MLPVWSSLLFQDLFCISYIKILPGIRVRHYHKLSGSSPVSLPHTAVQHTWPDFRLWNDRRYAAWTGRTCLLFQIFQRTLMGRNDPVAEIEIFLPSGNGIIRASEWKYRQFRLAVLLSQLQDCADISTTRDLGKNHPPCISDICRTWPIFLRALVYSSGTWSGLWIFSSFFSAKVLWKLLQIKRYFHPVSRGYHPVQDRKSMPVSDCPLH